MNNLIDSMLSMVLDVYHQDDVQDINTGAIKKSWSYAKSLDCHAKGVISNSATSRSGDKQSMGTRYTNEQLIELRTISKLTYRDKITNIRDQRGNVIWSEIDYPVETPTVFEIISITPITDPFGSVLGYNSVAKRSENQVIGI